MANKALFKNDTKGNLVNNSAGGKAYKLKDREALAQLAATGCLSGTFHASARSQLDTVKNLVNKIAGSDGGYEFIAKLAIYARKSAFMKDTPAYLLSFLAIRDSELYERTFPLVMDNAKMIRNHVQIIRSGEIDGRKSLPRAMRRQIKEWFARRKNDRLFKDSVGNNPSIADVIKMVRPRPQSAAQEALYSYLIGKKPVEGRIFNATEKNLPTLVKEYEACKKAIAAKTKTKVPNVPFQMLDSLDLSDENWMEIARNARWQMTRMNINTFQRHGVFENAALVNLVANRLRDPEEVKEAKAFPYQLMAAYMNATNAPFDVREALQDAMEIALENIPKIPGNVWVFPDVSGSMGSPITGYGSARPSSIKCVDVAALVAAALLRTNKQSKVIPFSDKLELNVGKRINPRDSVMTNAEKFKKCWGGGTYIALPLDHLAKSKQEVDVVIYISDNQSWMGRNWYGSDDTEVMKHWEKIKKRNPNAKMICIDIQPYADTQAPNRDDIMNIGGFSDSVWDVVAQFAKFGRSGKHWVDVIEEVDIPEAV